jgi:D-alanyl-D-alanine carboxypeptidase
MKRRYSHAVIGAALAAALLIAPVSAGASPQPLDSVAKRAPVSSIDKTKVMAQADRVAIDGAAAQFLANSVDQTPGLWLAVWDPKKGYYEKAYGFAELPATAATVADHFRIGSITKTVFATAVLQQVAAGKLKLTDTVAKLDPALAKKYPQIGKYSVAQMLSMKTQIPDYADAAVEIMIGDPRHRFTRNQLIALAFSAGKPVGKEGGYSTTNYIILGVMLQKLTGKSPESLVNGVFKQAGMTQSRLPAGSAAMPPPAAHGYVGAFMASTSAPIHPELTPTTDVTSWALDWGREGGGAYSTIGDLATWGGTCLGNALLPKSMVAKRLVFSALSVGNYGRGIIQQGDWLSHGGQVVGMETNVACNPKTGAVVAYGVNSTYGTAFDLASTLGPVAFPEYYAAGNPL